MKIPRSLVNSASETHLPPKPAHLIHSIGRLSGKQTFTMFQGLFGSVPSTIVCERANCYHEFSPQNFLTISAQFAWRTPMMTNMLFSSTLRNCSSGRISGLRYHQTPLTPVKALKWFLKLSSLPTAFHRINGISVVYPNVSGKSTGAWFSPRFLSFPQPYQLNVTTCGSLSRRKRIFSSCSLSVLG